MKQAGHAGPAQRAEKAHTIGYPTSIGQLNECRLFRACAADQTDDVGDLLFDCRQRTDQVVDPFFFDQAAGKGQDDLVGCDAQILACLRTFQIAGGKKMGVDPIGEQMNLVRGCPQGQRSVAQAGAAGGHRAGLGQNGFSSTTQEPLSQRKEDIRAMQADHQGAPQAAGNPGGHHPVGDNPVAVQNVVANLPVQVQQGAGCAGCKTRGQRVGQRAQLFVAVRGLGIAHDRQAVRPDIPERHQADILRPALQLRVVGKHHVDLMALCGQRLSHGMDKARGAVLCGEGVAGGQKADFEWRIGAAIRHGGCPVG